MRKILAPIVTPFFAYHGTTSTAAKQILDSETFDPGDPREDHWLGQGSYFYREDPESAKTWAFFKIRQRRLRRETPTVLSAKINATERNFLNLDSRSGMERFKQHIDKFRKDGVNMTIDPGASKKDARTRCLIMSMLPLEISVIQRTFKVDESTFDDVHEFREMGLHLNGTQICVRDPVVIIKDTIQQVYPTYSNLITRPARKEPRTI
ncbi:hypothetical protein ACPT9H_17915 [Brevibacillus borstelensis]|uniref:hypothetical protein n=1 Tax=Brevibacillus borstelensis TaxID=45462 RepID=UPI003CE47F8D